jgi:thioredoxin 1
MAEIAVSDKTFDAEVVKAKEPVLVDFWAVWCGPCQMQNPILEELEKEFAGKVKFAKLNVDENPTVTSKYMVMSIPTLMIFKGGSSVKQMVGVQSKEVLVKELNQVLQ